MDKIRKRINFSTSAYLCLIISALLKHIMVSFMLKKNIILYIKLFQKILCDMTTKICTNNTQTRLPCYNVSINESHLAYGLVTNGMHSG